MLTDLDDIVDRYIDRPCEIVPSGRVPARDEVGLGQRVAQLEATTLAIDIRQFTGMTNALGRLTMVKMLKAFFEGTVALVALNGGAVADFNGDGMITLFVGHDRTERAVRTAGEIRWFIEQKLRPKFSVYFDRVNGGFAITDEFDAGCGIDDGIVLVARVGTREFSDIAWVGRSVNSAAKLCKAAGATHHIMVTHEAYERLDGTPFGHGDLWTALDHMTIGGATRTVFSTAFSQAPGEHPEPAGRMTD